MFLQVPDNDFSDHNFYIDAAGNEFLYDDFAGKWLKKQKEKRDANPKVIARRQKRDENRIAKGKPPRHGTSAAPSPSPAREEAPPKIALVPPTAPAPGGGNSSPGSAAENSPVSGRGTEEAPPAGTAEPGTAPSPQGGAQAAESAAAETQTGETSTSATTEKKKPFGGTWLIIAGVVVVGGLIAINLALNSKAQQ